MSTHLSGIPRKGWATRTRVYSSNRFIVSQTNSSSNDAVQPRIKDAARLLAS